MTQSFDAYDINKAVKDLIAGNSVVIGESTEPYTDPNTKTTFFPRVMGIPIDDEEASRVSKLVDGNGNLVRPMLTARKIPKTLLNNTDLAAQYIDQYDLEDKTPEEIEQHFYENMVEPNVKRKETIQTAKPPGSLTINNNQGTAAEIIRLRDLLYQNLTLVLAMAQLHNLLKVIHIILFHWQLEIWNLDFLHLEQ
jgi:hypothetical protein